MNPVELLRWVGPLVMLLVVAGGIWALLKYKLGKDSSISSHISEDRNLYVVMGLLLTFGGALFYLFIAFWLVPTYNLHPITFVLLIVAFIAQLGLAWVPENRRFHTLHFISAAVVAVSMIILLGILRLSLHALPPISSVFVVAASISALIYLVYFIVSKGSLRNFLIYECFFIGLFATTIFALALAI